MYVDLSDPGTIFKYPFDAAIGLLAAGWLHGHQLIVIEFLQAENRLL